MANWDVIRKEWENNKITLKALAEKHGVKLGTLKSRKSREGWSRNSSSKKNAIQKGEKVATSKKDATCKPGAPIGNKNAVTTGEFETIMWDYLDDQEKELFENIETDPLYQIDVTIRELSIRQRRMMKRIKQLEDGLTESEKRILRELKTIKDAYEVYDEKTSEMKRIPVKQEKLVVTEMEETQYRKIDDILNIEEALTRITNQLVKAVKQKHDMEKSYGEQPLKLTLMQAKINKINTEVENISSDNNNNDAEDWVTALKKVAEKRKVKRNEQ